MLSRAYQRAHLCGESVQWAKTASERAPAKADLQAEPLVEYGASLKACADEAPERDIKMKLYNDSAGEFRQALDRLRNFSSGPGGKLWYELGGLVGAGWKFDVAKKDQYERLLVDTYAGLCEVEGRLSETCSAIDDCEKWIRLRGSDPEARLLKTSNAAAAANRTGPGTRSTRPCGRSRPATRFFRLLTRSSRPSA